MSAVTTRETEMREALARQRESGLSLSAYARSIGLSPGTLRWWKTELRRRDERRRAAQDGAPAARLLAVHVGAAAIPVAAAIPMARTALVLRLGDVELDVPSDFDAAHLQRVLAAVRGC